MLPLLIMLLLAWLRIVRAPPPLETILLVHEVFLVPTANGDATVGNEKASVIVAMEAKSRSSPIQDLLLLLFPSVRFMLDC